MGPRFGEARVSGQSPDAMAGGKPESNNRSSFKTADNDANNPGANPMTTKEVTSTHGGIAIGGNVTDSQIVQGDYAQFTQNTLQTGLTAAEASELLRQLHEWVHASALPDETKHQAERHLETAREELEQDRDFAGKRLQKAYDLLRDTGVVTGPILGIWNAVRPFFGL